MQGAVVTVICVPDDGWRYHPKHAEQFTEINRLYIVASCWTVINTLRTGDTDLRFYITTVQDG